nr:hypothetical protein BaRGS_020341 [Batillaria attramentaria]
MKRRRTCKEKKKEEEDEKKKKKNLTPKVDDFVKAVFTTGRRQTETLYYAKVLEVVDAEGESECLLHYLKEKDGVYTGADQAWHPTSMIQTIVAQPSLTPGRRPAFTFN